MKRRKPTIAHDIRSPAEDKDTTKSSKFSMKFFKHTSFIKKFINNLKDRSSHFLFRHITGFQFKFIEDKSSEFNYYQRQGILFVLEII